MSSSKLKSTGKTSTKTKNGDTTRRRSGSISKDHFSTSDIDTSTIKYRSNTIVDPPQLYLDDKEGIIQFYTNLIIENLY